MGDYREAADALREGLRLREKSYGPENLQTAVARSNYGDALARSGEAVSGEAQLRHAIASYQQSRARDREAECTALEKLARWHLDSNEGKSALAAYESITVVAEALGPRGVAWKARVGAGRGRSLLLLDRFTEAGAALNEASRTAAQAPPRPRTDDREPARTLARCRAAPPAGPSP